MVQPILLGRCHLWQGKMQKHNLGFTGGNQNGNYYLSLTYLDNDGMVRGNNDLYRRLTATINAEYQIKPWLKVGTTNQIEKYNARSVSEGSEYWFYDGSCAFYGSIDPRCIRGWKLACSCC